MNKILLNHTDFFKNVIIGKIKLSNDRDADIFASWKVDGQDFYIYGKEVKTDIKEPISITNGIDMISQPLTTQEGYLNQACMNELEQAIKNIPPPYHRNSENPEWNKKHWVFIHDITSYLAKWAVSQSPYVYPEGLDIVVKYLDACLKQHAYNNLVEKDVCKFTNSTMMNLSLCDINKLLYNILYEQGMEVFDNWNKAKNKNTPDIVFTSRESNDSNPDDDFIDLDALLNNVCISLRNEFRRNDEIDREFKAKYGKQ